MNIPTIKELLKSKLLIAGLIFFFINLSESYIFFHINSYKIFLMAVGVSLIVIINDFIFPARLDRKIPWKVLGIISAPIIATLPAVIWFKANFNYNFRYELATNLILLIWVSYLYRGVEKDQDISPFIFFIGITIFYVSIWAILENIGYNPLYWNTLPKVRPHATFGNVNYFAGFLAMLLPIFLVFSIPNSWLQLKKTTFKYSKSEFFFLFVFVIGCIALLITQTRAAIVAGAFGFIFVIYFFLSAFTKKRLGNKLILTFSIILFCAFIIILLLGLSGQFEFSRFGSVFNYRAWFYRFVSWKAAINSIKDSPFIGFGLGCSYHLYFKYVDSTHRLFLTSDTLFNHAHSEILEYMQESGIFGLIILILFWFYIFYKLIKLIKSNSANDINKKLAIGILGGFVAYNIHGLFSVAPRMMVTKMPLFTLFALAFIILKLTPKYLNWKSCQTIMQKLYSFLPGLISIIIIWLILFPCIYGQYQFVKTLFIDKLPLPTKVKNLEKVVTKYPDIYALDYLSSNQIYLKKIDPLKKTINLMEKTLPNYKVIGHKKMSLALMQNDFISAKNLGLKFQKQYGYYKLTNIELMKLAISLNDIQLFIDQFKLFNKRIIFENNLINVKHHNNVIVQIKNLNKDLVIQKEKNRFMIQWNQGLVDHFFYIGRVNQEKQTFLQKQRNNFLSSLRKILAKQEYFNIKIYKQYKKIDTETIHKVMKSYFKLIDEKNKEQALIQKKHIEQQSKTNFHSRFKLEKKQAKEMHDLLKNLDETINIHNKFLSKTTDWQDFLKKRNFVINFLNEFTDIIYPSSMIKKN